MTVWDAVQDGDVDYDALDAAALDASLADIASANLDALQGNDRYAFLINAYNVCVMDAVRRRLRRNGKSVGNLNRPWTWLRFFLLTPVRVAGKRMSLYTLEFRYIRPFLRKDARGHFALVCAATGCPPLRDGQYHGDSLDAELDASGHAFLQPGGGYDLDRERGVLRLNRIMKWYAKDFGGKQGVLAAFRKYAPQADAKWVKENAPKLRFLKYDWSLNIAK